eukprot:793752-Alexandrium_andersonii.AAC.1
MLGRATAAGPTSTVRHAPLGPDKRSRSCSCCCRGNNMCCGVASGAEFWLSRVPSCMCVCFTPAASDISRKPFCEDGQC